MKKTILIGSLLATGLLFAKGGDKVTTDRLSYFERQALETQSPRVHTRGMEKHKKYDAEGVAKKQTRPGYTTVSDKTSINAYIPQGK
jgi:hypothetical protein